MESFYIRTLNSDGMNLSDPWKIFIPFYLNVSTRNL